MEDRHLRSLIKGFTWRTIGTLDTILLAWIFTGALSSALTIGGIELITKTTLYYIHERFWGRIPWGKAMLGKKEHHCRSLCKGIAWRLVGSLDTTVISFFVTGNAEKATQIGLTELFTKTILYYLHERAWTKIHWGRTLPVQR